MRCAWLAVCLALLSVSEAAPAATYPVDDSRSQVLTPLVRMAWDDIVPGRRGDKVHGAMRVVVRLDVRAWRGRSGRIFMTLPPHPLASLQARWTTRGVLMPGALLAGQRALVHAGPITTDLIEDTIDLTLVADGGRLSRNESVEFRFEIDLDHP